MIGGVWLRDRLAITQIYAEAGVLSTVCSHEACKHFGSKSSLRCPFLVVYSYNGAFEATPLEEDVLRRVAPRAHVV